jgi:hypothetical protein
MFAPKLNHPMMPERKSATLNIQAGTSMQITPGLLSSDEVVRAISSRVQYAVVSGLSGQIGVTGAVTVNLVDGATGQVLKTVSSLFLCGYLSLERGRDNDRRVLLLPKLRRGEVWLCE